MLAGPIGQAQREFLLRLPDRFLAIALRKPPGTAVAAMQHRRTIMAMAGA